MFNNRLRWYYVLIAALLLPALFINLGYLPIFYGVDEATRALVAKEMTLTGDFIVPTINGEHYLKKPPVWNWILVIFTQLFGETNFVLRLPAVLSFLLYAGLIFHFTKPYFQRWEAVLLSLMIVTTGRVLIWESLFAYIDPLFCAVLYANMMLMWRNFERRDWSALFNHSYLLTAVGFLLKNIPSLVVQAISLLVLFTWQRQWRKAFSAQHFVGMLFFFIPVALYYGIYSARAPLQPLLETIFWESGQRTPLNIKEAGRLLKHLVNFPIEMWYHYLPWTLPLLFFLFKKSRKVLRDHPFIKWNLLVGVFNILPYWLSPGNFPKYILMLVPCFFTVGYFAFTQMDKALWQRGMKWFFTALAGVLTLGALVPLWLPETAEVPYLLPKSIGLLLVLGLLFVIMWGDKKYYWLGFVGCLLAFRIAFNWFALPPRIDKLALWQGDADRIVEITEGEQVRYFELAFAQYALTYELTKAKNDIIPIDRDLPREGVFYLVDQEGLDKANQRGLAAKVYHQFLRSAGDKELFLVKFGQTTVG